MTDKKENPECTCEETSKVIEGIVNDFDGLQKIIIDHLEGVRFIEKMQQGKCCTSEYALHCILKNLFAIQLAFQNRDIETLDDLQEISNDYIQSCDNAISNNATIH